MKKILFAFILIGSLLGCVSSRTGTASSPGWGPFRPSTFKHEVKYEGETLGQIASWYTGDQENWREIAKWNADINPKAMRVGTIVEIPESMIVRRDDLPRRAVTAGRRRAGRAVRTAEEPNDAGSPTDSTDPKHDGADVEEDLQSEILRDKLEDALLRR